MCLKELCICLTMKFRFIHADLNWSQDINLSGSSILGSMRIYTFSYCLSQYSAYAVSYTHLDVYKRQVPTGKGDT